MNKATKHPEDVDEEDEHNTDLDNFEFMNGWVSTWEER